MSAPTCQEVTDMAPFPRGDTPHGHPAGGPRPPVPRGLRLLLWLTLVSFAATVLDSAVQAVTAPGAPLGWGELPGFPELSAAVLAVDLALTTALYALVWFPLRRGHQWGWVLGLVLCSLAVLGGVFNLLVFVLDGHLPAALSTLALVVVNAVWLAAAGRPGVRSALR